MTDNESFNPYQAPEVQEQDEVHLGEDSEFLISEREILCRETVELPKVCIHTGMSEDLIQRQETFHSFSTLFGVVAIALFTTVYVSAGLFAGLFELVLFATVLFVLVRLIPGLSQRVVSSLPGVTSVTATWYVNRNYARRGRRNKRITLLLVTAILLILSVLVISFSPGLSRISLIDHAWKLATICAVSFGILSVFLRTERKLACSGRRWRGPHKGLFVLTGHSRRFAEVVERIIHGGF